MDEDATECGENCSFEDGKDWDVIMFHLGWHEYGPGRWPMIRQELEIPWVRGSHELTYRRVQRGTNTQKPEAVATRNTQIW